MIPEFKKNLYHNVITNMKKNQVNDVVDNEMIFDSNSSLSNYHFNEPKALVIFGLKIGKRVCINYTDILTCLLDSRYYDRTKKEKQKKHNWRIIPNKV